MADALVRFTVYALLDPETREPRYVGVTRTPPRERAMAHVSEARLYAAIGPAVQRWLQALPVPPLVRVLATCSVARDRVRPHTTPRLALALERSWIVHLSKRFALLNSPVRSGWENRIALRRLRSGLPVDPGLRKHCPHFPEFWRKRA
jgi:hypothetical protein